MTAAMAALERRRMASFCRIRKPLLWQPASSDCKSVEMTDSQQDGFFEAVLQ